MPRIFDNIELALLPVLRETLKISYRSDFCVGYFNLRGWWKIDDLIAQYIGGEGKCCRLLIGMQSLPRDEVSTAFSLGAGRGRIDNSAIIRLKKRITAEFREQLTIGAPSNRDEIALKQYEENPVKFIVRWKNSISEMTINQDPSGNELFIEKEIFEIPSK